MLRSVPNVSRCALPERVLSVRSLSSPSLVRRCPRCGQDRPFVSSGAFRVNAQKRRLDVWLVRRCLSCEATWNQRLHQRVAPEALGDDLERYHRNDPILAARVADDPVLLAAAGGTVLPGELEAILEPGSVPCIARIELVSPVSERLDKILCQGLGLSRSALLARVERGEIEVDRRLAQKAVHGTCVILRV